ncbi:Asp-tRNA(Asn)/Glu-tRNA(Gln) amidotransferase subunit GatC [Candidatus Mycoplasma pogonae]
MDFKKLQEVGKSIHIDMTTEAWDLLEEEYDEIIASLANLKAIDTENVIPLFRIGKTIQPNWRADVVEQKENISKAVLLKNSKNSTEDFIILERVVND